MARFITFEGIEGSGKTTQIQILSNYLEEQGLDHLLTREPGGTPIGDQVRKLVLNPSNRAMTPTCEMLLYSAARAQHIEQVIGPSLEQGRMVLCDRFKDATLAYQGYGRGLLIDMILALHGLQILSLQPDLTLLFDIDPRTALARARSRDRTGPQEETRFEQEEMAFHERVRRGYLELAQHEPERFVVVDARGTVEEVHRRVLKEVQRFLATRGAPD